MKKLTKKQRHEIYKDALSQLIRIKHVKGISCGICAAIQDVSGYHQDKAPCAFEHRAFGYPEFDLFFENETEAFLPYSYVRDIDLDLFEIRQLVLMFCIEMTR